MPKRATSLTGAAGEHYVAYKLSALGYPTALTRGGSPVIELMVGDISGNGSISIQVKTSNSARRVHRRVKIKIKTDGSGMSVVREKTQGGINFLRFCELKGHPKRYSEIAPRSIHSPIRRSCLLS